MYRILIADDHPLFREAIGSVISSTFEGCETLETECLDDVLTIGQQETDLDLILLDLNMPGMQGLNGLITLRNACPTIPVVIVSAEEDKKIVLQALTYGAIGFITKSSPRLEMASALQQIMAGSAYLPSDVIRGQTAEPVEQNETNEQIDSALLDSLTRKQLLVLERMAKGESNKQIAWNLNIAETTVKAHVSAVLRKLGVHNRIQAVLNAGHIDFNHYIKR